jgi:ring-1,2-phenylacetyl-CoA epoxidase subunit PaaE
MLSSAIEDRSSEVVNLDAAVGGAGRFYPLKVRSVRHDTRDSILVVLDVPPELRDKFQFIQGQYLTFRAEIEGQEIRRSYSICSAVQDGVLRVGIKRAARGLFSNWAVENLKSGDVLQVMPPEGRFYVKLCPTHEKHYVAIAAGSGITPVFSIVKTTLLAEPKSRFTLFYGNRASSTIMLREELAELKDVFLDRFSLIHVMTREHQDLDLLNGRITGQKCELLLKHFCGETEIDTVFLCGPQELTDELFSTLRRLGFPDSRTKIELFSATTPEGQGKLKAAGATGTAECHVTIRVDGGRHMFSLQKGTESILDAALHRGIDLRHSCKSGVCATCRAKLVDGQVDMDANYALEDYEIARGFILTCQSYPVTDQVTVDFDQDN